MDKDMVHIYKGILLSHEKNKIMPFVATWMDLKIIKLSKIIQTKANIIYYTYVESNFFNDTNELIHKAETFLQISKTILWLPKEKQW